MTGFWESPMTGVLAPAPASTATVQFCAVEAAKARAGALGIETVPQFGIVLKHHVGRFRFCGRRRSLPGITGRK